MSSSTRSAAFSARSLGLPGCNRFSRTLFADLRGLTAFAETAAPEALFDGLREYHGVLGEYHGVLGELMRAYQGTAPVPSGLVPRTG